MKTDRFRLKFEIDSFSALWSTKKAKAVKYLGLYAFARLGLFKMSFKECFVFLVAVNNFENIGIHALLVEFARLQGLV